EQLPVIGPQMAGHMVFPRGANVEFVKRNQRNDVSILVWGRDGRQLKSSSIGACAVVVAGVLTGRTERQVIVRMQGGNVSVNWSGKDGDHLYLTGSARELA